MKGKWFLFVMVLLFGSPILNDVFCQETPPIHQENNDINSLQQSQIAMYLSFGVLVFGLMTCILESVVLFKKRDTIEDQSLIRVFGITLIIISGVFLITAGYSVCQIGPMMGLLGTVAGYLLAKQEPR
jgi:hypothetical protein